MEKITSKKFLDTKRAYVIETLAKLQYYSEEPIVLISGAFDQVLFKHEQLQVFSLDSHVTFDTIHQT